MNRPVAARSRPVAGHGAALVHRQPDLVRELATALDVVMDAFVDVDAGFENDEQRRALELAEAVLAKANRQGVPR